VLRVLKKWVAKTGIVSLLATILMSCLVLYSICVPIIGIPSPTKMKLSIRHAAPLTLDGHILGTDQYGRDILSRVSWGTRYSFLIGFVSVLIATSVGMLIGAFGGLWGGAADLLVQFITDVLMTFPTLVLGVLLVVVLGRGMSQLILAISLALLPRLIRISRGKTIPMRTSSFIEAARALGSSRSRVLFRHILPNVCPDMMYMGILWFATAILLESGLGFLGLGLNPPTPSLGSIIRDGLQYVFQSPWECLLPGIVLMLLAVSSGLIGDSVQELAERR